MARPFKCRRIDLLPGCSYFKPAGVPVSRLQTVTLTVDEYESLRLADLNGLYQEDAAKSMQVSRQTFGNIIKAARQKMADSLINGKALKIEGGHYLMEEKRTFRCSDCEHEWQVPFGTGRPGFCPQCQSKNIHRSPRDRGFARDRGFGHGRNRGRCS